MTGAGGKLANPGGQPVYTPSDCQSQECDIFAVDRHIKTPYMENYNLNIQQQITNKTVLQLGYVGSQGHRLFRFYDINQPTQAAITASDLACTPAPCINDFGVPRPFGGPANRSAGTFAFGCTSVS